MTTSNLIDIIFFGGLFGVPILFIIYVKTKYYYSQSQIDIRQKLRQRELEEIKRKEEIQFLKSKKEVFGVKARDEIYINDESEKSFGYSIYIQSPQWKETRRLILLKRGNRCEMCKEVIPNLFNLHLHHLTYEYLYNEYEEDLMLLCKPCHEKEHGRTSKVVDLSKEILILKMLLNQIMTDMENISQFNENDMNKVREWIKENIKLLISDNHPFNKMRKLLTKVTQHEMVIYPDDIKKLHSLCLEISVNVNTIDNYSKMDTDTGVSNIKIVKNTIKQIVDTPYIKPTVPVVNVKRSIRHENVDEISSTIVLTKENIQTKIIELKAILYILIHIGTDNLSYLNQLIDWQERNDQLLNTKTQPFNRMLYLLQKTTEPKALISMENLKELDALCQTILINLNDLPF